jgi:mannose-6-phosphate isomerase-like protein (cupin superfamily)
LDIIHRHWDEPVERFALGQYLIGSFIGEHEEGRLTAYRVEIPPRTTTPPGYHAEAEEIYYVISGEAVAHLNGLPTPLRAGDFLRLPPGTRHGFQTFEVPLLMLDIHSPGSRPGRDVYFPHEQA